MYSMQGMTATPGLVAHWASCALACQVTLSDDEDDDGGDDDGDDDGDGGVSGDRRFSFIIFPFTLRCAGQHMDP